MDTSGEGGCQTDDRGLLAWPRGLLKKQVERGRKDLSTSLTPIGPLANPSAIQKGKAGKGLTSTIIILVHGVTQCSGLFRPISKKR